MNETQAELVLDWYCDLEGRFCRILGTIPYTEQTRSSFLPPVSSIVLEASSLLDTIFRFEYSGASPKNNLNITDFAMHYDPLFHFKTRRSVLLQFPARYIMPFHEWINSNGEYCPLPWWQAYNSLKHDRISSYELSTLDTALSSICALHQAIALLPCFVTSLFRRDLIVCGTWNPKLVAEIMKGLTPNDNYSVAAAFETELFSSSTAAGEFPADIMRINVHRYGPSRLLRHLAYVDRKPKNAT